MTTIVNPVQPSPPAEPTAAEPTRDRPWRRAVQAALPVWVCAYAGYLAVTVFAWFYPAQGPTVRHLLGSWTRYDATVYARIAGQGYHNSPDDTAPAFFPLYPMLGRMVHLVLPVPLFADLLVVSAAALLAMLTLFYRLVEFELDRETAGRAIWLMMLFPSAFFLGLGFNESLFISLLIAMVYALRRGHWWLAGTLGGFATLTRSIGLLLCLAFGYEYLRQRGFALRKVRLDVAAVALVPTGLGAFMIYLWADFGDPFAFVHAMAPWKRQLDWPWVGVVQSVQQLTWRRPVLSNNPLHIMLDLGAVIFVGTLLVLAFVGPWRLRRDQLVMPLIGAAMLIYSISFPTAGRAEPLMGSARYVLEVFSAFMVLARIRPLERGYTFVALLLQGLLLTHFVQGGWVA